VQFRLVKNGEPQAPISVSRTPFTYETDLVPPQTGEDFWRAEVLVEGRPRTITSNLWMTRAFPSQPSEKELGTASPLGCGCDAAPGAYAALLSALMASARGRARGGTRSAAR
jgi:hypothetical protein